MNTTKKDSIPKKDISIPNSFTSVGRKEPLSSLAQKIEAYAIMQIDTFDGEEFPEVEIDVELVKRFGVLSSNARIAMEKSYKELLDYKIEITLDNGNKFWTVLCTGVEEIVAGDKYKLSFHPKLKPMFLKLKGDFAKISFDTVLGISSVNYV